MSVGVGEGEGEGEEAFQPPVPSTSPTPHMKFYTFLQIPNKMGVFGDK